MKLKWNLKKPSGAVRVWLKRMCSWAEFVCIGENLTIALRTTRLLLMRGRVLPIGGLKEKLLAAHRGGISIVLIPEENRKDLAEIPKNVKDKLDIRPVKWIDEVLQVALTHLPVPLPDETGKAQEGKAAKGKAKEKPETKQKPIRAH